ncbi:MAG: hypothetical protein BHV88_23475 [Clostridiales bacterium 41_12_two_minus]|nr:MAG: hypothetical protein BHV88_23475 [Clostridiales bacterium 41_12_two_minus]
MHINIERMIRTGNECTVRIEVTGVVTAWAARKENATDRHCSHCMRKIRKNAEELCKILDSMPPKKEKEKENKK